MTQRRDVQTIEQTGKPWKARQAIGAVMVVLGFVLLFALPVMIGSGVIAVGLGVHVWGRLGAWWEHA